MGSKPKKESNCPVEGVYLHDGICTREANLLQYKQTGFVINILLMRALNNMGRDEEKMDIALNYENGELTIVDSVNPNKKYNKTFFDRVGRGVKIGSYNARGLSSELKQFLKDNPQYKDNSLIKSLVALKDKK